MKEAVNQSEYLFASQAECCKQWYSYAKDCEGPAGDGTADKYLPDYGNHHCTKKQAQDLESHEQERYDSLEGCCADIWKFAVTRQDWMGVWCNWGGCVHARLDEQ